MLISLWKEHELKFKSSKFRNDTVWKEISAKMRESNSNWHYSATQCENKWKDVRKIYVKVKDHNNTSGNDPKTCKFYDDIDDILGDKPNIKPVSIASNIRKRPLSTNSILNCTDPDLNDFLLKCDPDDADPYNNEPSKIKRPRIKRDFDELSAGLRADAKQREEAREKRHKEMLKQSDKVIDSMKEIMQKVIEKL